MRKRLDSDHGIFGTLAMTSKDDWLTTVIAGSK